MSPNARSKMVAASSVLVLAAVLCPANIGAAAPLANQTASAYRVAPLAVVNVQPAPVVNTDVERDVFGEACANCYSTPLNFKIPDGTSARARKAVAFALAQRGKWYKYGATGPNNYDCSGLTMKAWAAGGKNITRTTYTQRYAGTATTASKLLPGDLVLVKAGGSSTRPNHVGMYIGRGLVIHSPKANTRVKIVTYKKFSTLGIAALRHIA